MELEKLENKLDSINKKLEIIVDALGERFLEDDFSTKLKVLVDESKKQTLLLEAMDNKLNSLDLNTDN